jgi:hypothetical protein
MMIQAKIQNLEYRYRKNQIKLTKNNHLTFFFVGKHNLSNMKLRILAVSFVALLSSSDALPKQDDKQLLRASKEKKQPVQDNVAKGVHFKDRAMEEKAKYSVSGLLGSSTERDNSRANKKKKQAEKEKIKALGSTENEAGAYELKPKHGNDKKADEATPTHNQIGLNIVGGDQSSVGDFPYYGMLHN